MEHYKQLLLRLQTIHIRVITRKQKADTAPYELGEVRSYDLRHENPVIDWSFKSEIKGLMEMATTDLLNLSPEQARLQLNRLEVTKEVFDKFERNYYTSPDPLDNTERRDFFFNLQLDELFIVPDIDLQDSSIIFSQDFINDLYDTVQYRKEYLKTFKETISKLLDNEQEKIVPIYMPQKIAGGIPVFKEEIIEDLYNLLKEYFGPEQREPFKNLLLTGASDQYPLIFIGRGNQLADAFKQLIDAQLIVGCLKSELERWILTYFHYRHKGKARPFTAKYLNDIISTDTRSCQSPILDAKRIPPAVNSPN